MKQRILLFIISISIVLSSCSLHWTEAIRLGEVLNEPFNETIQFEENLGLIIVPVEINGKIYRFLWDTGATSSVSDELQNEFHFEVVSQGHYVDTDNNRQAIDYVQVDTLRIGDVVFIDQVAFVENFKANPILKCMALDGIIGGNLIRYCNWTIDYEKDEMVLSSDLSEGVKENSLSIPFKYDNDLDILVDIKIGRAKISNIVIDYGSNGSISLPKRVFDFLKEKQIITETFVEAGTKNSGLIGKPVKLEREYAYTDSLFIGEKMHNDVEVREGVHALIGKKILSRYLITIDWDNQRLYFNDYSSDPDQNKTFGFALGVRGSEVYVQSVIKHSPAFIKGLEPEMIVTRLNSLDFTKSATYCNYIDLMNSDPDELTVEYQDEEGNLKLVTIKSQRLIK